MGVGIPSVGGLSGIISYIQRQAQVRSENNVQIEGKPGTNSSPSKPDIANGTKLFSTYKRTIEAQLTRAFMNMADSMNTAKEIALGNAQGYAIGGKIVATSYGYNLV